MWRKIKDYIKTRPRLYDAVDAWRPLSTEIERWIARFAMEHQSIRFIQIGASDGLRWDPFRRFVIAGRWQGLFVEPLPDVFVLLKQNYAYRAKQGLQFLNAAVSDADADLLFWTISEEFLASLNTEERLRLLRKASFNRDHVLKALEGYEDPGKKIMSVTIPSLTFKTLIERHWPHDTLDLVMIDAEGHDDAIIRSMNLTLIQPKAILFEAHNLGAERKMSLTAWLAERHYSVRQLGGDAVAVLDPDPNR